MKVKILSSIFILVLLILGSLFINRYVSEGIDCTGNTAYVILKDDKSYQLIFPFETKEFCGILKSNKDDKRSTTIYKDGYKNGLRQIYYENGKLLLQADFVNDLLDGQFVGWYENGQKAIETFYKNDLESGQRIEWYKNGAPKSVSHYKKGKKDGEFITWYDKGSMSKEGWKQNNSPKTISSYKDDIDQGDITFDISGKVISKKEFK